MPRKHISFLLSVVSMGLPALAAVNDGSVRPNDITLAPGQQQQFSLSGYGTNVTWWVQPTGMGSITSSGLYTAPASIGVAYIYAQPVGNGLYPSYFTVVYLSTGLIVPGGTSSPNPSPGPGPGPTTPTPPGGGVLDPGPSPTIPTPGPTDPGPTRPTPGPVIGPIGVDPIYPGQPTPTVPVGPTSISILVTPASTYLQAGQSAVFTALVQGTADQQVQWSLNPNLGSIVNGRYTAPTSVGSDWQVTISATSVVDRTKTATATVLLGQPVSLLSDVSISIGQGPTTLIAGQSAQFTALVVGSTNTAVNWSVTPNVGSLINGYYTAPANITSQETVTLTALSVADPSKTASVSLVLKPAGNPIVPTLSLSLTAGSVSLTGGQSATFTSTVNGTANTAVTWSISPQVGTITNGVYQAPLIISSQQTVTVTATSVADSTVTASTSVSLQPIGVTVGPASAALSAGQSATFTAAVTGTSNTAVNWSVSPSVGTLVNGVYTAPASIASSQTLTVTAASVVDSTKTATATVTLTPGANNPPPTTITLPLEVIGPNGMTVSASVNVPSGSNLGGQLSLWMQIHGLRAETQASVQVNNSGWIPISSSTVTILGNAAAYGGIGGGFGTLKMTMNLPSRTIQPGANTISFRFNQTDGRVSGFRVLAFNIQAADGSQLIPASTFVNEDPNSWQPPSTSSSDIATGQTLWHTAALTIPLASGGTAPILAHCSDCHAQDGRDLKYFNYSNNSIQARSLFHGLTAQQGDQIASYIRSLNVPNPGRPWNPPYQPGPGLDSQPVSNWAAGAGLDAVLDTDQEMVNAMFPSGFQSSVFAGTSRLNTRELPLPVQLPDWNQWLPGTHPIDAFGSAFTSNGYFTIYQTLSSSLQVNDPTVYVAQQANFNAWFNAYYGFNNQMATPIWNNPTTGWTPANVDAIYSLAQWGLVKSWELNNQFQLEGMAQNIFGPQADPRAWYSNFPFFVSPHELKMPTSGVVGLRNGSQADYNYLSYIWYNLQLILNDSNGQQSDQFPIDWPYAEGFVKGLGSLVSPQAGLQTMWLIKGLQAVQQAGATPQAGGEVGASIEAQISVLVTPEQDEYVWTGVDPATRAALANGIVTAWLAQVSQFTPQQYYAGGWTTPTAVPVPGGSAYDNVFPDWVWYMIPRFNFVGVNPALTNQLASWAQTLWPAANWTADLNAACSWQNNVPNYMIQCSQ
jgi:hypothetical protein